MIKRFSISVFVLIILVVPFGQYVNSTSTAAAQSTLDPWITPVNVSRSGSTSEPSLVVDSNGFLHVFWYDNADEEFFYTRMEGNAWTEPIRLNVPFENEEPRFLLYDPQGVIHAFWTNEDNELYYAYISVASLIERPAWSRIQFLSAGVMDLDAKIDSKGRLHIAYLQIEETSNLPAGIYHRSAEALGRGWSDSTLLNVSRYFRSVKKETANVKIAITQVGEIDHIFVAWDNRTLRQVFLIKSTDGGNQWQEAEVIDGPSESTPLEDPFNLLVHAYGSNVLLTWEAGLQSGFDCSQYSQFSTDLGETWLERQTMYKNFVGCPQDNRIFDIEDGAILMSTIQEQVYLTAWNGVEWSEPQPQGMLSSFTDPETFVAILFRCHQPAFDGKQLYVAGCDIEGGGDVWVTSRTIETLSGWFGQPTGWTSPVKLTDEQQNVTSPVLICTPEGQKHVFWSQTLEDRESNLDTAIFYARLDDNGWTEPTRVLNTPDFRAVEPAVLYDNQGYLIATWSSSADAGTYSGFASIDDARNEFNWSKPLQLPSLQLIAASPDIQLDQTGIILVVYAIRVNEDRGIYLTRSDDGGKTWIQPIKVFDAVKSKWTMVNQPKLAQTSDGVLHLIWTQNSISEGFIASALYYARSDDDGRTWSQPQLVIEESIGSINILSTGERTIQIFWLSLGKVSGIFHQFSTNGGESWSAPENISGAGNVPKSMAVVPDLEGRLHLFQAIEEQVGRFSIDYSFWNGARWFSQDSIYLGDKYPGNVNALDICLDSEDRLATVFTLIQEDESNGNLKEGLYFTSHSAEKGALEAPALTQLVLPTQVITTTLATQVPVESPTPAPGASETTVAPTPTVTQTPAGGGQIQTGSGFFDQPWVGLALGLGLAFIIVVSAFGLVLHRRRQRDYRL